MNTRSNLLAGGMMAGYGMSRATYAPDPPAPAATESSGGANNPPGNQATGQIESQATNNTGTEFDPRSFWKEPEASPAGSPKSGSADSTGGAEGQQGQEGKIFSDQLAAFDPGQLFTKEIADQIAEGKLDGVNANLKSQMQGVVQQSFAMSAQLMKMYGEKLQSQFEAMIEAKLGNRDNTSSLGESFTAYKDPAMKPVIDGVFAQAMKLSKGDRTAAIASTREMLKYMGKTGASDMGITIPPGGPGDDYGNSAAAKSLVDELLGR